MTAEQFRELLEPCFIKDGPARQNAMERLFVTLRPYLWVNVIGLSPSDTDLAQDALQTAFLKYMKLFETRRSGAGLGLGYFVTIARRCFIDEIRRRKRHINLDELLLADAETPSVEHSPETGMEAADREEMILLALQKISPRCRFILERYYIAGVKTPALAEALGISPQSVGMTVKRCREEVKRIVSVWLRITPS